MGQQARNKKLFVELEATAGTAETVVNADAVRTSGLEILRYGGERVSRDYDRAGMGSQEQINVNPHAGLSNFLVPFVGSGATATAPPWADLLLACATAETDDTISNDEWFYTPVDDGFKSVTCVVAEELVQQQMAGVRGNFSIQANPGQLPVFVFSGFLGDYARPVQLALNAADDSAFKDALPVTFSNTSTLTVDGDTFPVAGFTFDAGVTVERLNQPNRKESVVTDRRPTGSIIISPATHTAIIAMMADIESHAGVTTVPIVLNHGSGAGNILQLDIYAVQFGDVSDQVVAGETYYSLPFQVLPDASGDEWKLTQQ